MVPKQSKGRSQQKSRGARSRSARKTGEPEDRRHDEIAVAAYYRAQGRGFAPGHELEDWLEAESEVSRESAEKQGMAR